MEWAPLRQGRNPSIGLDENLKAFRERKSTTHENLKSGPATGGTCGGEPPFSAAERRQRTLGFGEEREVERKNQGKNLKWKRGTTPSTKVSCIIF